MAEAAVVNETLSEADAAEILEELLPAQNHAYVLGLKLKLHPHDVEAIHLKYLDQRDRLLHIIIAFLRQAEPRLTWRIIVEALRNPIVNLQGLAKRVEAAHFPDFSATRDAPLAATGTLPSTETSGGVQDLVRVTSSEEVKKMIDELKRKFAGLKNAVRECLEKHNIRVKKTADVLTSLSPDDDAQHKIFLEDHVSALFNAADNSELFGTMNFHWNYLNPSLLDHLVQECDLEEVKGDTEVYKSRLRQFRIKTPLTLFCRAQKRKRTKLSPDFQEVTAEFDWTNEVTLEDVEQFRQKYASHYNLHDFSMMLAEVRPGSFIITWFIPQSIVEKLKAKVPRGLLKQYSVTKLEISGVCVYRTRRPQGVPVQASSGAVSAAVSAAAVGTSGSTALGARPSVSQPPEAEPSPEDDYQFVEAPPDDFFCPVTYGVLLQPHLTSCCGKHLSQEAATRIQRERRACPLCKTRSWSTVLNKHFQRTVYSLRVFCRHEERGCGWQGELAALQHHVQLCPMADAPLMSELVKLPLYGATVPERSRQTTRRHLTVQCHSKRRTPCEMIRGSATTDGRFAYFSPRDSTSVYQYEYSTEKWKELPACPYDNSGLVIIDRELTAVGGSAVGGLYGTYRTNKLYTLRQREWVEKYPPMNTARTHPAVVSTSDGKHLIVIGGYGGGGRTATIELFQVKSRRWYQLTDLPQYLHWPSATICGDLLHVIRGIYAEGYSCSLRSLPSSGDQPIPPQSLSWTPLPSLPVTFSTAATLCGQLVLIGGLQGGLRVNSIHQLVDGQWVENGSMASTRSDCLVVSPSPDKIIIVGGWGAVDSVEERVAMT